MKNRWLLLICGVLNLAIAVLYFQHADYGYTALRDMLLLGRLMLAAAACTIAAGAWAYADGRRWLLVLNGLGLSALGLLFNGVFGFKIRLLTIALVLIVMALSLAVLTLENARLHTLFRIAGMVLIAFAGIFAALGFHLVLLGPESRADAVWIGSYFAFSAMVLFGLALWRDGRTGANQVLPGPNPTHAHQARS
ncbi:MAG TPA: hypothetical protein VH477_01640 [Bryobacteraceae bacterium]